MASRTIRFENGFNGESHRTKAGLKSAVSGRGVSYDMLYGALASVFIRDVLRAF